jgi:hypothetical protein
MLGREVLLIELELPRESEIIPALDVKRQILAADAGLRVRF